MHINMKNIQCTASFGPLFQDINTVSTLHLGPYANVTFSEKLSTDNLYIKTFSVMYCLILLLVSLDITNVFLVDFSLSCMTAPLEQEFYLISSTWKSSWLT